MPVNSALQNGLNGIFYVIDILPQQQHKNFLNTVAFLKGDTVAKFGHQNNDSNK